MTTQAQQIRQFILEHVAQNPGNIVDVTAKKFHVTRTTIHRHLNHLLKDGQILKSGITRTIQYQLKSSLERTMRYKITPNLSEFVILQTDFNDIFQQLPEHVYDVCVYGFTEIVNNAIDHSKGSMLTVSTSYDNELLSLTISDNGIGVFQNIRDYFQFANSREAVLQLTKGKTTTAPVQHTGEGIFFTSRAFEQFEVYANNLHYLRDNKEQDWALESINGRMSGSMIRMSIHRNSSMHLIDLFKKYQDSDDFSFSRSEVMVALSRWGNEPLISRSQAKRILFGLDKFRHITLDFSGVRLVGQGFVDEVFRVFLKTQPQITIDYIHANDDVTFMIERSLVAR